MATVEVELRNYVKANGTQPLVLRITSGNKVSRKNTGLYIKAVEWDEAKHRVNRRHSKWAQLNDALDALCREAEGIKAEMIKDRRMVTPAAVISRVFTFRDFYDAARAKQSSFTDEQAATKGNYDRLINRLSAYRPELAVEEVTPEFVEAFRRWMEQPTADRAAYAPNTIRSTLSKMKAVLNSIELKGENPFKEVVIGAYEEADPEPLTMDDIRKLRNHMPNGRWQRVAKDIFLFSFYAAGMRAVDVLQLQWSSIKDGRIDWKQSKVKKSSKKARVSIPLNAVTEEILSRQDRNGQTVFGLVTMFGGSKAAMKERDSIRVSINKALQAMANKSGVYKQVNLKLARTSFGRIANQASGRNVYGIQQAMGHSDIRTTEIYLGSDNRAVDELLSVVYA